MSAPEDLVFDVIRQLDVPYETIMIDPAFADTALFCERYGYPADKSANTIIVASKKEPKKYAACVVLATARLDVNRRVTRLMAVSKASFATADEMKALTGMEVGGVTPFALPADLPLYVDEAVMKQHWVILGGGGRTLKIRISPDVFRKLGARIVSLTM